MPETQDDVTTLLHEWSQGDPTALHRLIPLVFEDLREIANRLFKRENDGHTLQPTALVNEAYCRLLDQKKMHWENRSQFFSVAALLMRRILVDYAKSRHALKRGNNVAKVPLDEALHLPEALNGIDHEAMDEALSRLAKIDQRAAKVVELRFYMGLEIDEIAKELGVSPTTVKRDWKFARIWLFRELKN